MLFWYKRWNRIQYMHYIIWCMIYKQIFVVILPTTLFYRGQRSSPVFDIIKKRRRVITFLLYVDRFYTRFWGYIFLFSHFCFCRQPFLKLLQFFFSDNAHVLISQKIKYTFFITIIFIFQKCNKCSCKNKLVIVSAICACLDNLDCRVCEVYARVRSEDNRAW